MCYIISYGDQFYIFLLPQCALSLKFDHSLHEFLSYGKNLHKMPNMIKCTIPNIYNNFFKKSTFFFFNTTTSLIGVIKSKGWMEFVKFDMQTLPKRSLRWCLFFGLIEKVKIFGFFYSTKSNMLISSNITKLNLLITSSF